MPPARNVKVQRACRTSADRRQERRRPALAPPATRAAPLTLTSRSLSSLQPARPPWSFVWWFGPPRPGRPPLVSVESAAEAKLVCVDHSPGRFVSCYALITASKGRNAFDFVCSPAQLCFSLIELGSTLRRICSFKPACSSAGTRPQVIHFTSLQLTAFTIQFVPAVAMDIDADSFPSKLLGLLINISEADFVSFDLELSGIPSRLPAKAKPGATGRKTLEDRYLETRVAADRYQILQVGITCGRFDYLKEKYVLRPYNITLSPLLRERLDFEREICIQSGAASFLLDHDFDMGAPFRDGVQYLSRQEAELAEQLAHDRIEKKNVVEDLHLKEEDVDSLDFVRRVRKAIITWKNADDDSSLVITTHTGLSEQPPVSAISRFEKRLVHQLVRAEFEDLVSLGRADCIRIIRYDALREEENTKRLKRRVKEQIARQTGFRWVFEALADGDLDQAAPFYFPSSVSDQIIAPQTTQTKDRFDLARARLRKRQPVLVGHNMFTDLVYFYRTFVGELPDTLDGFCEAIHALFPKIIDTKYLATHAEGDLNASPTLQEIAEKLQDQPLPDIGEGRPFALFSGADGE